MLTCYNSLEDAMKEACACFLPYWELVEELGVCIDAIRYAEEIYKNEESTIKGLYHSLSHRKC